MFGLVKPDTENNCFVIGNLAGRAHVKPVIEGTAHHVGSVGVLFHRDVKINRVKFGRLPFERIIPRHFMGFDINANFIRCDTHIRWRENQPIRFVFKEPIVFFFQNRRTTDKYTLGGRGNFKMFFRYF